MHDKLENKILIEKMTEINPNTKQQIADTWNGPRRGDKNLWADSLIHLLRTVSKLEQQRAMLRRHPNEPELSR